MNIKKAIPESALPNSSDFYPHQTQIFTGLFHNELEFKLFEEIFKQRASDSTKPIIIICGSRLLSAYLTNAILSKTGSLFNIRLISYYKLRNSLALLKSESIAKPEKPAQANEVCALRATQNCTDGYFQNILDKPGFQKALAATFADINDSSFDFQTQMDIFPEKLKTSKWKSLADLYLEYQHSLSLFNDNSQIDGISNLGILFDQIYGCKDVIFYGFYDFTGCQFEFIRHLADQIACAFYIPYYMLDDSFGSAFQYAENTVRALLTLPSAKEIKLHPEGGCAFKGLGTRLFRYKPEEASHTFCPASRQIRFLRSGNPVSEVNSIVSRINKLCLWENIRFDQVGILLWNADLYRPLFIQALEAAGIPYYDSIGARLMNTTAGRALTTLLHLVRRQIKRRDLIDFLADFSLNLTPDNETSIADVVVWERISIEAGIIEGTSSEWMNKLEAYANYSSTHNQHESNYTNQIHLFIEFIQRIFRHANAFPESASMDKFAQHTLSIAKDLLPAEAFDNVEPVISGFFQFDVINGTFTRRSFESLLSQALAGKRNRNGRQTDGVLICDKMAARGVAFEAMFIPGLCQGSVPTSPQDDPILSDSERQLFTSVAKGNPFDLPLKGRRRTEERLLFALAVDSSKKHLYLSYPARDIDKGAQTFPSRYLLDVARIVIGRQVDSEQLERLPQFEDDSSNVDNSASSTLPVESITSDQQFMSAWIDSNISARDRTMALRKLYSTTIPQYNRALAATFARATDSKFTEWDGILPVNFAKEIYAVTELEAYCQCPFRYFLSRVMGLDVLEEPETMLEIPPHLLGSIIHSILEKLFDRAKRDSEKPLEKLNVEWFENQLTSLVPDELRRRRFECQAPEIVWILEERRLMFRLKRFLRNHIPSLTESEFSEGEFKLESELHFGDDENMTSIRIAGRIDRVDMTSDKKAIRIIDYKTGNKPAKINKLNGGINLQLPLYLKALLQRYPSATNVASLSEYVTIGKDGSAGGGGIDGKKLTEMESDLTLLISTVTEAMRNGHFPPFPNKHNCDTCNFVHACSRLSRDKVTKDTSVLPVFAIRSIDV